MNLNIKATKTTLTPAIRAAIQDKLAGIEKFLKSEDKVHLELEVSKKQKSGEVFRVEITILPHNFYAESSGSDFYAALDLLMPKIKEQLVKQKDKKLAARKRTARSVK